MDHAFNVKIAKLYSVNIALFLQHIAFWTHRNIANKKHYIEGHTWTYCTQEGFGVIFPYWTRQNIRTVISNCIKEGLIVIGNYNKSSYDKTCWYALTDKGAELFPFIDEAYKTLGWNQPIEKLESTNRLDRINQPIPDTKTDTKTDTNKNSVAPTCNEGLDNENKEPLIIEDAQEIIDSWNKFAKAANQKEGVKRVCEVSTDPNTQTHQKIQKSLKTLNNKAKDFDIHVSLLTKERFEKLLIEAYKLNHYMLVKNTQKNLLEIILRPANFEAMIRTIAIKKGN